MLERDDADEENENDVKSEFHCLHSANDQVSLTSSSSLFLSSPELSDTTSMILEYEPASEPLQISVK